MKPPVPTELSLRDVKCMPIDVDGLRDSPVAATANPEAFRAWILLSGAAWREVPVSSLPNDDAVLARHAGLGRDLRAWHKIRAEALFGFVLCDDGRLYHQELAKQALEVHAKRTANKQRVSNANAARRANLAARRDAGHGHSAIHCNDGDHGSLREKHTHEHALESSSQLIVIDAASEHHRNDHRDEGRHEATANAPDRTGNAAIGSTTYVTKNATETVVTSVTANAGKDLTQNVANDVAGNVMKDVTKNVAKFVADAHERLSNERNERAALMREAAQEDSGNKRTAGNMKAAASEPNSWESWVKRFKESGDKEWLGPGPPPNNVECRCPMGVLRDYGYWETL